MPNLEPTAEQPFTVAKIPASSWAFAIRVWLAIVLALFVCFWLQLEVPSTAAVTVAILAEPTRGQALEKAAFRLTGTVVGVTSFGRPHPVDPTERQAHPDRIWPVDRFC